MKNDRCSHVLKLTRACQDLAHNTVAGISTVANYRHAPIHKMFFTTAEDPHNQIYKRKKCYCEVNCAIIE